MFEDQMIEMLPARTTMSSCHPSPCGGRKSSGGQTTNIDNRRGWAANVYLRADLEGQRWVGSTVELAGLCRDGSEVPVELSLSTWKAGGELFYTAVIRDITERKQAAEELRQREDQLRDPRRGLGFNHLGAGGDRFGHLRLLASRAAGAIAPRYERSSESQ